MTAVAKSVRPSFKFPMRYRIATLLGFLIGPAYYVVAAALTTQVGLFYRSSPPGQIVDFESSGFTELQDKIFKLVFLCHGFQMIGIGILVCIALIGASDLAGHLGKKWQLPFAPKAIIWLVMEGCTAFVLLLTVLPFVAHELKHTLSSVAVIP